MTYTTPGPSDVPDYYTVSLQAGTQVDAETIGPTAASAFGVPFYVGNTPSITIYAEISCTEGWAFRVNWSLLDSSASLLAPEENYTGYGNCVVVNTIPVLGPWCVLEVFSGDGPVVTAVVEATSSLSTARGSVTRYNNALCIDQVTVIPGLTETTYPGLYLTPGLYQFYFQPQSAFNGQAYFQASSDGSIGGRLASVQTLAALATFDGQLVVGNMQPALVVNNLGAGAVSFYASLVGPV